MDSLEVNHDSMFQKIDFSEFKTEKEHPFNKRLFYADFYGLSILSSLEKPTYFGIREFGINCKKALLQNNKFPHLFDKETEMGKILSARGFNCENSTIKIQINPKNGALSSFCDSSLLWVVLYWCDLERFIFTYFHFLTGHPLESSFIKTNGDFLGIKARFDDDGYLNSREFYRNLHIKTGLGNRECRIRNSTYKTDIEKLNNGLGRSVIRYQNDGKNVNYIYPNFAVFSAAIYCGFDFWSIFEKPILELVFEENSLISTSKPEPSIKTQGNEFIKIEQEKYHFFKHLDTGYINISNIARFYGETVFHKVSDILKQPTISKFLEKTNALINVHAKDERIEIELKQHRSFFYIRNTEFKGVYAYPSLVSVFEIAFKTYGCRFKTGLKEAMTKIKNELKQNRPLYNRFRVLDFNNLPHEKLNEELSKTVLDDIEVIYHRGTSYVHAAKTAENIALQKVHNIDRWFRSSEIQDYIAEFSFPRSWGDELSDAKVNHEIQEQLKSHPAYFVLKSVSNDNRGYYYHPNLFVRFIIWLDSKRGYRYLELVLNLIYESALKNQNLNDVYEQQISELRSLLDSAKEKIETLKKTVVKYEALTGSIKFTETEHGEYKARPDVYNQIEKANQIVIPNVENVKTASNLVYKFIQKHPTDFVSAKTTKNRYNVKDVRLFLNYVKDIIGQKIEDVEFRFNQERYNKYSELYKENQKPQTYGFLFELEMSRKYKANLFADASEIFRIKFGFGQNDTGFDLVDEKNKIIYQCKHYKRLNFTDALKRTLSMFQKVHEIDEEYQLKLIINKSAKLSKQVVESFGEEGIIYEED